MNAVVAAMSPLVRDLQIHGGWASLSLERAIRRTMLTLIITWHFVLAAAAIITLREQAWSVGAVSLGMAGYSVAALRVPRLPVGFLPLVMAATGAVAYHQSGDVDSVLVFAACWQINFATCVAGLLILRRWILPAVVVVTAAISASLIVQLPEWGVQLPVAIFITQCAIIVALRVGLRPLIELARRADREEETRQTSIHRREVARRVSTEIAEQTRVLHDTAINTLGAIANGGASGGREQLVREQAARDVTLLERLRSERRATEGALLRDAIALSPLPVTRLGLSDEEVDVFWSRLDPLLATAVIGAVREALTNAGKHSGASAVELTVSGSEERLAISVRDEGVGFSGETPANRGVANSIAGRARDHGFEATLHSAPGAGTTVDLRVPLVRQVLRAETALDDVAAVVAGIHRRAGLLWAAGVTAVSIVLTAAGGTNEQNALFPMIAIMVISWTVIAVRRSSTTGRGMSAVLGVSAIAVFALAALATDLGSVGAVHWQALAATGPAVLLLSGTPPRGAVPAVASAWTVTVVILAALAESLNAAAIVIVAASVAAGFAFVWRGFQRSVEVLCADSASAQREAFLVHIEIDSERAAQLTYRRWVDAGLDSAVELLRGIAQGQRSPGDAATRQECDEEESYLRQLVLISPEVPHLGEAIIPLLQNARFRSIPFTVRLGSLDTADQATAESVAAVVLLALDTASSTGSVVASVFHASEGLQLTVTGPALDPDSLTALTRGAPVFTIAGQTCVTQVTFAAHILAEPPRRSSSAQSPEGRL